MAERYWQQMPEQRGNPGQSHPQAGSDAAPLSQRAGIFCRMTIVCMSGGEVTVTGHC